MQQGSEKRIISIKNKTPNNMRIEYGNKKLEKKFIRLDNH